MSGLLTYKTNLKSLKFGKDRPYGGDSNQPYIESKIPSNEDSIPGNIGDKDFIVRGGIGAPLDALDDVVRLGKYFTDLKSVSGPLFIAKQNILSRIATATQASGNLNWKKAALNEGIYTPLSTLIQAGIGFLGGHVDKQGLNPFKGITTYTDVVSSVIGSPSGMGNRLVDLTNTNRGVFSGPNIFSYSGGPNSAVGIGKTHIQFAKDNQGGTLRVLGNDSYTESYIKSQTGLRGSETDRSKITEEFKNPWGASKKFVNIAGGKIKNFGKLNNQRQFLFHGGIDLDYIDSSDNITWDNVRKNTTINPYVKSTIAGSSKPGYIGNNSTPISNIPIGASLRFADITRQGKSVKIPSSFGGNKVLSSAIVVDTNGIANVSGVAGSIEENKNIVEITSNGGLTWEIPNISTNTFDPIVPISKLANPTELFKNPTGDDATSMYMLTTKEIINSNLTSDNGISWQENLTNPYTTGVKGTLATKTYVPRNFKTSNPTELFVYPEPEDLKDASGLYGFISGDNFDVGTVTSDDGISLRQNLIGPYTTGIKGTLATKNYLKVGARKASYGSYPDPVYPTINVIPASNKWENLTGQTIYSDLPIRYNSNILSPKAYTFNPNAITSVYKIGTFNPSERILNPSQYGFGNQNYKTLNQSQIYSTSEDLKDLGQGAITDFRTDIEPDSKKNTIMSIAPDYRKNAVIDNSTGNNNYHYTSPGQKGNISSYSLGKRNSENKLIGATDKINAYPIYQSRNVKDETGTDGVGDLVNFRIESIGDHQGKNPKNKQYIHFRAYIDSFDDQYTGNWDSIQYMGRGEKFYKYNNFERSINLSFTVAAQSRQELEEQYKKLNYLVSNLAPSYSEQGYMGGPLIRLSLGNWCYELPGFIGGLTLGVPEESPWEIGIEDDGKRDLENGIMQLPHIVKVTGLSFTPIHTFRPSKQKLTFEDGKVSTYGIEKYIAYRKSKIESVKEEEEKIKEENKKKEEENKKKEEEKKEEIIKKENKVKKEKIIKKEEKKTPPKTNSSLSSKILPKNDRTNYIDSQNQLFNSQYENDKDLQNLTKRMEEIQKTPGM